MIAISLWQPWATLWLLSNPDEKVFETRSWYTGYRGFLLVHAAKKRDGEVRAALADQHFIDRLKVHGLRPEELAFGAIIGQVNLLGGCRMDKMPAPTELEEKAGYWEPHRFAWERRSAPTLFKSPISYRGSQGFFNAVAGERP